MAVLRTMILDRLSAAAKPGEAWGVLVFAPREDKETLEGALSNESPHRVARMARRDGRSWGRANTDPDPAIW